MSTKRAQLLSGSTDTADTSIIASTDVSQYRVIYIHLDNPGVDSVHAQYSNDEITWYDATVEGDTNAVQGNKYFTRELTASTAYMSPVQGKFFRLYTTSAGAPMSATALCQVNTAPSIDGAGLQTMIEGINSTSVFTGDFYSGTSNCYRHVSTASINEAHIVSNQKIMGIFASNSGGTTVWLKLYKGNPADDGVLFMTLPIPPLPQTLNIPFGYSMAWEGGIGIRITANSGDADVTAIAANNVILNIQYR